MGHSLTRIGAIAALLLFGGCVNQPTQQSAGQQAASTTYHGLSTSVGLDSVTYAAQYYDDLSNNYNYHLVFKRIHPHVPPFVDTWHLRIIDKKRKIALDSITQEVLFRGCDFRDFSYVTSYITRKNVRDIGLDNDYGDFLIADFNFDTREDIALLYELSNSGSMYYYYIQDEYGNFRFNPFLSDSMKYFPTEIKQADSTLVTYVRIGALGYGKHVYRYNSQQREWRETRHEYMNAMQASD